MLGEAPPRGRGRIVPLPHGARGGGGTETGKLEHDHDRRPPPCACAIIGYQCAP
jgi:hypothetical protein